MSYECTKWLGYSNHFKLQYTHIIQCIIYGYWFSTNVKQHPAGIFVHLRCFTNDSSIENFCSTPQDIKQWLYRQTIRKTDNCTKIDWQWDYSCNPAYMIRGSLPSRPPPFPAENAPSRNIRVSPCVCIGIENRFHVSYYLGEYVRAGKLSAFPAVYTINSISVFPLRSILELGDRYF